MNDATSFTDAQTPSPYPRQVKVCSSFVRITRHGATAGDGASPAATRSQAQPEPQH